MSFLDRRSTTDGRGKIVHILFPDGQERVFYNASIDTNIEGWLYVTRLEVRDAPISGVAEPIAGYRLDALLGWEYVEPDEQTRPAVNWLGGSESGGGGEHNGDGDGNGNGNEQ